MTWSFPLFAFFMYFLYGSFVILFSQINVQLDNDEYIDIFLLNYAYLYLISTTIDMIAYSMVF